MNQLKLANMLYRSVIIIHKEERIVEIDKILEIPYTDHNNIPTQSHREKARIEHTKRGIVFWTNIGSESRPSWVTSYAKKKNDARNPDFPTLDHFLDSEEVESYQISDNIISCKLSEPTYSRIINGNYFPELKTEKLVFPEYKLGGIRIRRT